jgi:hypothetical protein
MSWIGPAIDFLFHFYEKSVFQKLSKFHYLMKKLKKIFLRTFTLDNRSGADRIYNSVYMWHTQNIVWTSHVELKRPSPFLSRSVKRHDACTIRGFGSSPDRQYPVRFWSNWQDTSKWRWRHQRVRVQQCRRSREVPSYSSFTHPYPWDN